MAEVFEQATCVKLRFESSKGCLSTEEVWDLSLAALDMMAKTVNKRLREAEEESFIPVAHQPRVASHDMLRLDVLKHIITTKAAQRDVARARAENRAKLARLKEVLAVKEDDAFKALSQDELLKQIAELEAAV